MPKLRIPAFILTFAALLGWSAAPVAAQSILRDAETEALLRDMARPLVAAAGLDPANVDIVLVNDSSVNAFVAGGQAVYINSGLINEAGTAGEVQGVIAHELGHVTGGHAVLNQGASAATSISLLSLLLGAAAAAAGGGEAAMGVIMAGQQAAMGKYLAYSRSQEATADAAGAQYLSTAGVSGRGSLDFFKRLQNLEFRYGYRPKNGEEFYSTHPLTGERIATLQDTYEKDPAWSRPDDPRLPTVRFPPAMPGPTPIIANRSWTRRGRRPTRWLRSIRAIPISSSCRARSCLNPAIRPRRLHRCGRRPISPPTSR
jgi:predicted Zn-dependent protease